MTSPRTVAIVGGGLAGLSCACTLAEAGLQVTLFERRPYLGGRASSYVHPGTGEVVDNCQHVLLGCCTSLVDFYRRIGVQDRIRWYERLTFIEPGGRRSIIEPSFLPAPFHTTPAFLRFAALSLKDKLGIARAMLAITPGIPADDGRTFLEWLHAHRQTERAIERFWKTVLVSALNEDLDRVSIPYGAMVFRESFLRSRAGGRMGVPSIPLGELYATAGDFIRARGGETRLRAAIESFQPIPEGVLLCVNGGEQRFDFAVMAVPFDVLARLLPADPAAAPLRAMLERFETSPITGIHLWFDRPITDLDHAVLLDRTIQWMFHKSKILATGNWQPATGNSHLAEKPKGAPDSYQGTALAVPQAVQNTSGFSPRGFSGNREPRTGNSYVELVVSASKSLVDKSRQEIIDLALRELKEFFPDAADAQLLKAAVIKEVHATFSPLPGCDAYRPGSASPWPNIFVAGDWTATGWPSTMESAVRSGYRAADALKSKKF